MILEATPDIAIDIDESTFGAEFQLAAIETILNSIRSKMCVKECGLLLWTEDTAWGIWDKKGMTQLDPKDSVLCCCQNLEPQTLQALPLPKHLKAHPHFFEIPKADHLYWVQISGRSRDIVYGLVVASTESRLKELPKCRELIEQLHEQIQHQLTKIQLSAVLKSVASFAKWKVIAELSTGIAHEINDPLSVLRLRLGKIQKVLQATAEQDLESQIQKCQNMVERIHRIVKGLRSIALEKNVPSLARTRLLEVIDEVMGIAAHKLRMHNITVEISCPVDFQVYADEIQLSQVIGNLINNAIDVLVDWPQQRKVWVSASANTNDHVIEIGNSGPEVQPTHRDKIFRAFFTSKTSSRGLGLGLAIAARIMRIHGGHLELAEGSPTRFMIRLPATPGGYCPETADKVKR